MVANILSKRDKHIIGRKKPSTHEFDKQKQKSRR